MEHLRKLKIRPEEDYSEYVRQLIAERYAISKRDSNGKITHQETIDEMWKRVAMAVALADVNYGGDAWDSAETFHTLMASGAFLPNTPCIMNAGRPKGQLCACFILPIEDDIDQQLAMVHRVAMIHKSGGGTGISFSNMRPKGDPISSGGFAYGFLPLARVFDEVAAAFKQSGRRRGANMGTMHISHPEIEDFITCKKTPGVLENFNLSVMVDNGFIQCVEYKGIRPYFELVNPRNNETSKTIDTKELFDKLVRAAWETGEPGLLFENRLEEDNPCKEEFGAIVGTNPCGEVPLPPPAICNLGSINLTKCVVDGKFDLELFADIIEGAVHFLDNVIDVNHYPFPEFSEFAKQTRVIGLGVMGWHDLLLMEKIPYNSGVALERLQEIASSFKDIANICSLNLACKRGCAPIGAPYRNAMRRVIAPTGSISLLAGECSSGIEPVYDWKMERRILTGDGEKTVTVKHPLAWGINILDDGPDWMVIASEIPWEYHIKHQAGWQKHIDGAVSKTINMPASATTDDVRSAFLLAHELGCKGITVYRDGSRAGQILSSICPECNPNTVCELS